jgi:hypothetical protein
MTKIMTWELRNVCWQVRGVKFNWDDHTLLKVSKTEMSKIPQKVGFNLAESRYLNLFRILFKVRKFQTVNSQKRNWKFFFIFNITYPTWL